VTGNSSWSSPELRSVNCQVEVNRDGMLGIVRSSINTPKSRFDSRRARSNSRVHQSEASQLRLTRKITASQRLAALVSASSQRSPGEIPRSGWKSIKTSSQPEARSQPSSAAAAALSRLEWLTKTRVIGYSPPAGLQSAGSI